jgi:hypothetical protein
MTDTITHFIWGYQKHFRVSHEHCAQQLFLHLDPELEPSIFIVGIRAATSDKPFPACIEPEDEFWIQSEDLDHTLEMAAALRAEYPEAQMFHSHPLAQQREDETLDRRAIRDTILSLIENHSNKPADVRHWVSFPVMINGYWVAVVLELRKSVIARYPSLKSESCALHEFRSIPIPESLISAAAQEFLRHSTEELSKPEPALDMNVDVEDLLRRAGQRMTEGIVLRIEQNLVEGYHHLFRDLTLISSLNYERSPASGTILLARKDDARVLRSISFASPTHRSKHRSIRKLLELTATGSMLHSTTEDVLGLAQLESYDPVNEDVYEARILGHHRWQLVHAEQVLMQVSYGLPSLQKAPLDPTRLIGDLKRLFPDIDPADAGRIVELVETVSNRATGALLIVTPDAEIEATRLSAQATPIAPTPLTPALITQLTAIDGAILLTPTAEAHAIGTILDGIATSNGDPGRGSRYNSAVRYVESRPTPCLAIITSDDGGIDFVPALLPVIRRDLVDEAIASLEQAAIAEAIPATRYRNARNWLDSNRFYLLPEDCDRVNELLPKLEKRLRAQESSSVWPSFPPFAPHPDMDPTLYYVRD